MTRRLASHCLWATLTAVSAATARAQDAAADSGYGARAKSRADRGTGTAVLSAEQASRTAGALGEPARAITNLAGVGRAGFDSGEVIVWGSTDNETRAYLDGVDLPILFHPGGFRSSLHPALLDTIALTKGAPSPAYGRGLGGVVELDTRKLAQAEAPYEGHAALSIDTLDVSGMLQAGVGPVSAVYAARLGYIDRLTQLVKPSAGDIVPVPEYADGFAKVQLALPDDATLSVAWLGTHDSWTRGTRAVDPASSRTETQNRGLQLGYVRYERALEDRARVTITPFIEQFARDRVSTSGDVPWQLSARELRYGLRADYTLGTPELDVQVGLDALAVGTQLERAGTLTLPPREGDVYVFGQPPGSEITRDRWRTFDVNVAPYLSLRARWQRLTVSPGARLEMHALTSSRALPTTAGTPAIGTALLAVRPEPRLSVRYDHSDALSLSARAGLSHQAPAPEDRSALFGNPRLGVSESTTFAGGPHLRPASWLDLELTGFYKRLSGVATRNPALPQPPANVLLGEGSGYAFGGEVVLAIKPLRQLSGQLSYTLSRARRQDIGAPERFFDFDQTHVLTFMWGYQLAGFRLSGRARVASGSPRTAVIGSYANLRDDRAEPIFGEHNGTRLPTFFALDLRVERSFVLSALTGAVWLDVLNLTDHKNVEDLAYQFDYRARQDVVGLPILAVLGISAQL